MTRYQAQYEDSASCRPNSTSAPSTQHPHGTRADRHREVGQPPDPPHPYAGAGRGDRVPDRAHRALMLRITSFIEEHLGEAGLAPAQIAAARTLACKTGSAQGCEHERHGIQRPAAR